MNTTIRHIPLNRLVPHPDRPNRMSRATFAKLVRNMERAGWYEPLVVRPCPGRRGFFQIINGHHRCEALRTLGHKAAEVVVWKVNDEQTDLLLATLNRLGGRDTLDRKLALLRRLSVALALRTLAQLLPQTRGQLERLVNARGPEPPTMRGNRAFATPIVFFADEAQERLVTEALAQAAVGLPEGLTRAGRRAAALARLARRFLDRRDQGAMSTLA
jgi:ParB-like chromosome segregation protein Spo0J